MLPACMPKVFGSTQAVGATTLSELKLELCKVGMGLLEKCCLLPYHHNQKELKATKTKLAIVAVS